MERISKETFCEVKSKLQQATVKISSTVKCIAVAIKLEDESNEPKKAFYLFSLMLLASLIFLSPDKIPQAFTRPQTDIGILEKAQEIVRIIKKFMANLG